MAKQLLFDEEARRSLKRGVDALADARVREAYAQRLQAQQDGLRALCQAAGFGFSIHHTDYPPEAALLALYLAMTAR